MTTKQPFDWRHLAEVRLELLNRADGDKGQFIGWMIFAVVLIFVGLLCISTQTWGHEMEEGLTPREQEVVQFLQTWHRPSGNFEGIVHREKGCCYVAGPQQDCFPVKEVRRVSGHREVFPDTSDPRYMRWYDADKTGVSEDMQPDPRESPDGRNYVCIQGEEVVCMVWGSGQ